MHVGIVRKIPCSVLIFNGLVYLWYIHQINTFIVS